MKDSGWAPRRAGAAWAAVLALVALGASGGALFRRFAPPGGNALGARRDAFVRSASAALQGDAGRLAAVASALQRSPEFVSVVDGGGAEVRPSRLFGVLSKALPPGDGWGAVFLDPAGRAVAWAGEAGDPEPAGASADPWSASFQVTRFRISFTSPRVIGREQRGALVVSRTYPTGMLRPDLIEYLSLPGAPTSLRLRAAASSSGHGLVALRIEPTVPAVEAEDGSRALARPWAIAAAVSLLGLACPGRFPVASVVLARLVVAAGSPLARRGIWAPLVPFGEGLLPLAQTPADLFLTGLAAILLLRLAGFPGKREPLASRVGQAAAAVAGAAVAAAAFGFVRLLGLDGLLPPGGLNLVPDGMASFLVRCGIVSISTGLVGGGALLMSRASLPGPAFVPAAAGLALLTMSLTDPGNALAAVTGGLGAACLAAAIGSRLRRDAAGDTLGQLSTAVFLVAAAAFAGGAGLADGRYRFLDSLLARAEVRSGSPDEREMEELPARWEARLSRGALLPWLPAGDRTVTTDLARALWLRGADKDYPRADDLLTVRDAEGRVASSFGLIRPGTERRSTSVLTELPLEGFTGVFTRLDSPTEADRDPVLSALVEEGAGPRTTIERVDYDAAGRAAGPGRDRPEIPPSLLARMRRERQASGTVDRGESTLRAHLREAGSGFVALLVPAEEPAVLAGTLLAAAEGSLPLVLVITFLPLRGRGRPRLAPLRLFRPATFRTRLVLLLVLSSLVPLAGSVLAIRAALERHSAEETRRRSLNLLVEARRALENSEEDTPSEYELNRAAAVLGTDLLLYRDGSLLAASRALPVAAGLAGERLLAPVAEMLAEGQGEASAPVGPRGGRFRAMEAAVPLGRNPREAIAVIVAEDAAARAAVDGIVLFAVAAALVAFGLGGRAALTLSRPIEEVTAASRRIGSGSAAGPIERPRAADLADLVDAFEAMAGQVRDRTELLARERAVAIELLANLTAAVLLFRDRDGEVVLANPKAEALLPGGKLSDRLSAEAWRPLRDLLGRGDRTLAPVETRVAVRQPEGERVYRVVVAPLPSDGDERRSALLLEDLTGFVRAERLTAWVEATRAIAHDIKNPLTPIRLSAERLLRAGGEADPARVDDVAATILRQVGILTERIGRLGRFSDPSRPGARLEGPELVRLLRELRDDFSSSPGVEMELDAPPDLPGVGVEREALRDALANLVVNSVEALGAGGGRIRLSARVEDGPAGASVRIECSDDGPGVGEADLEKIFEPSFSTKSRGSGMGLAAARRAIESQGGTVEALRNSDRGLSIRFRLPAR